MKKRTFQKPLALLMAFVLLIGMIPTAVFAEDTDAEGINLETAEYVEPSGKTESGSVNSNGASTGNDTVNPNEGGTGGNDTVNPNEGGTGGNDTVNPNEGGTGGNDTVNPDEGGTDGNDTGNSNEGNTDGNGTVEPTVEELLKKYKELLEAGDESAVSAYLESLTEAQRTAVLEAYEAQKQDDENKEQDSEWSLEDSLDQYLMLMIAGDESAVNAYLETLTEEQRAQLLAAYEQYMLMREQADTHVEGSVIFVDVGPTEHDVKVDGEGATVTIYCLQQTYKWPNGGYNIPYINASDAPDSFQGKNLLNAGEIEIMRRLMYAGYPNDPMGILHKYLAEEGAAGTDWEPYMAAGITQQAIWKLMAQWKKPGFDPESTSADPATDALIDFAMNGTIPSKPASNEITINGSGKLSKQADGTWATGALSITGPADHNPGYKLTLSSGMRAVNEDGYTLHSVIAGETFYVVSDSKPTGTELSLTAEATVGYPTDVAYYVTDWTYDKVEPSAGAKTPFQTMLYVDKAYTTLSGNLHLTTDPLGGLKVSKTVTGTDTERSFEFKVTLSDSTISGTYGAMTFKDGVAAFSLKDEESVTAQGLPAGVTYTVEEKDYTDYGYTTGMDGETGTITDSVTAEASFNNVYSAAPAEVTFSGTKTLTGKTLAAEEFSFTLTGEQDGISQTVTNEADGSFRFPKLTYSKAGVYTYEVREEENDEAGITFDSKIYNLTVTVTDNGQGQLVAAISGDSTTGENLDFANTYKPNSTSVVLGGRKTLNGFPEGINQVPEFTFTLSENGNVIDTATVHKQGDYNFGSISYEAAGVHTYTVAETAGNQPGIEYSNRTYTVKVTVTDNDGRLVAAISGDSTTGKDLNFVNGYKAQPASVQFGGTKTLNGRALEAEEFSFLLIGPDGYTDTAANDANGNYQFDQITYTHPGIYSYTIEEVQGNELGTTYDNTIYHITVTVTDDGTGALSTQVSCNESADGSYNFTNSFTQKSTSVELGGVKTLNHFPKDSTIVPEFTFVLKEGSTVIDRETVQKSGEYKFKPITYTSEGEHTYTVSEEKGSLKGISYSGQTYTVKVKVERSADNQLVATISGDSETGMDLDFVNGYEPTPVEIHFVGHKTLHDRNLKDGEFSFQLTGPDGYSETVTNDAEGKISFARLSFTKAGDYQYTVRELHDSTHAENGITYDSKIYHITVTVHDSGNGKLTASISGDTVTGTDLNFVNEYQAKSASVSFGGTKTFTGFPADSTIVPEFTFVLKEAGEEIQRTTVQKSGDYVFSSITYTQEGEHDYTVEELAGNQSGVHYDNRVYSIHVSVKDNLLGQLHATVTGNDPEALNFTNTYSAAAVDVTLGGQKTLTVPTGSDVTLDANQFTFELLDAQGELKRSAANGADGKFTFPKLTFNMPGEYTYTVKEQIGTEAGYTYDTKLYHITVTVKDSGNGHLTAELSGDTVDGYDLNFHNTYIPNSTNVIFSGSKTFIGFPEDSAIAPEFTFVLKEGGREIQRTTVQKSGEYDFAPITYTQEGTHDYTVEELAGHQNGVDYDSKVYRLHVSVTDQNGQLAAAISGGSTSGSDLNFENEYHASPAELHLSGLKTLKGRDLEKEEFSFILTGPDDYTETVKNDTEGKFSFTKLHFENAGTYNYTVKEVTDSPLADEGITFDSKIYNITVTVTDNGTGHLTTELSGDSLDGSDLNFVNEYNPNSTSVVFSGTKTLKNFPEDATVTPEFTFVLMEGDAEVDTAAVRVRDNQPVDFAFKSITYLKAGVHHYSVTEQRGNQSGVTYSKEHYRITVTVTDDGKGNLHADVSQKPENKSGLAFINEYAAAPVEVTLSGAKTLTGKTLAAEEFSFELKDSDGKVLQTVKNAADGSISFAAISFDKVGTYTYTVREKNTKLPGVTYDSKVYKVTVTVTDVGDGQLHAAVSGDTTGTNLNFRNVYTTGSLKVSKRVTGNRADKTKYFKFKITFDVDGVFDYTGSHQGTIESGDTIKLKHHESITITGIPAGTNYTVTESDNRGYSVHSTGRKGVILGDETVTAAFTNSRSSVPKTGDGRNVLVWYGMMGVCALGAVITMLLDQKKRYTGKFNRR